jgi:uncharacterized membrane protein
MQALSLKKILTWLAVLLLLIAGSRFLYLNVFHYFVFTEQSYTSYFWVRHNWVITHVFFGMTAFLLGPLQFIPMIRKKYVKTHRLMGKTYLIAVGISSVAAVYLAYTSQVNFVYSAGLTGLAMAWIGTSSMAYITIRKRMISLHREWMVRSYVVTFAFITFRLFDEVLAKLGVGPDDLRVTLLSWACWAVPLFITEIVLQMIKLNHLKPVVSIKDTAGNNK